MRLNSTEFQEWLTDAKFVAYANVNSEEDRVIYRKQKRVYLVIHTTPEIRDVEEIKMDSSRVTRYTFTTLDGKHIDYAYEFEFKHSDVVKELEEKLNDLSEKLDLARAAQRAVELALQNLK